MQIKKERYSFKTSSVFPYIQESKGECFTDRWYEKKNMQIKDVSRQNYLKLLLWWVFIVKVVFIFSESSVYGEKKNVKEKQNINF